MRVWKAHERGKLLERVRTMRILKQGWESWTRRLQQQRTLEGDSKNRICPCLGAYFRLLGRPGTHVFPAPFVGTCLVDLSKVVAGLHFASKCPNFCDSLSRFSSAIQHADDLANSAQS